ncbi:hypothetical protein GBA52_004532 [Prunus armeniaca]|nr:hypothetical protein GBA52_004532 [Prunus armeniaca]
MGVVDMVEILVLEIPTAEISILKGMRRGGGPYSGDSEFGFENNRLNGNKNRAEGFNDFGMHACMQWNKKPDHCLK